MKVMKAIDPTTLKYLNISNLFDELGNNNLHLGKRHNDTINLVAY